MATTIKKLLCLSLSTQVLLGLAFVDKLNSDGFSPDFRKDLK